MDALGVLIGLAVLAVVGTLAFFLIGVWVTTAARLGFYVLPLVFGVGGGVLVWGLVDKSLGNVLVVIGVATVVPWLKHLDRSQCECPIHRVETALERANQWFA